MNFSLRAGDHRISIYIKRVGLYVEGISLDGSVTAKNAKDAKFTQRAAPCVLRVSFVFFVLQKTAQEAVYKLPKLKTPGSSRRGLNN